MSGLDRPYSAMAVNPSGFPGHFPSEELDHLDQVFPREHGIIHHQVPHRVLVFSKQRCELLHDFSFCLPASVQARGVDTGTFSPFSDFSLPSDFSELPLWFPYCATR